MNGPGPHPVHPRWGPWNGDSRPGNSRRQEGPGSSRAPGYTRVFPPTGGTGPALGLGLGLGVRVGTLSPTPMYSADRGNARDFFLGGPHQKRLHFLDI